MAWARTIARVLKATPMLIRPLRPLGVFFVWLIFVVLLLSWAGELTYSVMHFVARGRPGLLAYLQETAKWHSPASARWEQVIFSHVLRALVTVLAGMVLWRTRRRKKPGGLGQVIPND